MKPIPPVKPIHHPITHLLIGLLLGFLSAVLTILALGELGEFIRPPLTFWLFFFTYWLLTTQPDPKATFKSIARWFITLETAPPKILILGLLWVMTYWLQLGFAGFGAVGMMAVGTLLSFASAVWMLKLRYPWVPLLIALVLLLIVGIKIDIESDGFVHWYMAMIFDFQGDMPVEETTRPIFKTMILIWQPIAFAALAIQMQLDKRRLGKVTIQSPT